ncbi:MAG: T9SS type A sorting domain-containing protein [Flavobacteriales bacterium]
MKTKLLILSCGFAFLSAKAQVVDISGTGVDFHITTASDTLYSMFDTFAGIKVTGHDEGHVWIDAPGSDLKMEAATVTIPTNITDVILELSDSMTMNLDESIIADTAQIKGGLKLGLHTYIHHTADKPYRYFLDDQQYRYDENFDNKKSTIFAPSFKNAERDSLDFATANPADNQFFTIHFWDNATVSFVTGYNPDSLSLTAPAQDGSTGSDEVSPYKDWTVYNTTDHSYQHFENEEGFNGVSEKFLPTMVDSGRAVVVYYGDTLTAHTAKSYGRESIYSRDGFHDGTIELDITNKAPNSAFFRSWHMIGNPYRSGLNVSSYLGEALTGATVADANGKYTGRTLSVLMDIDNSTAADNPGYVAINSAGIAVGLNDTLLADLSVPAPTVSTISELAAGQGFFIFHNTAKDVEVTTTFKNSMRTGSTTRANLLKQSDFSEPLAFVNIAQSGDAEKAIKNRRWSQLAVSLSDDIDPREFNGVVFKQDLSSDADKLMSYRDVNVYTQVDHKDEIGFSIRNVETDYVNKLIPVGFESKVGNIDYEFSLSKRSVNLDDYDVYVVDRVLNTTHNISKNGPYKCNIFKPGKQQDRFFLKFGHSEPDGFEEKLDLFSNGDFVFINSNSENTEIQDMIMYDITGRQIVRVSPNVFQSYEYDMRNLPRGVYFVEVTANGKLYKGKVLNNNN